MIEERAYERRPAFLALDPGGQTPLLLAENGLAVPGAATIAQYIDEVYGARLGPHRLMPQTPQDRVSVRRLLEWFNVKFFAEVSGYLVTEKVYKRSMTKAQGGGPPDSAMVRAAHHNVRYHMQYISYLVHHGSWLAGDRMTLADLAAAAHLSCVDFLGDMPWQEDEGVKHWYATIKSRPSFRQLLADRLPGLQPRLEYADLDF